MRKRQGQYGIKVIAAVAAFVAGGGSLLVAAVSLFSANGYGESWNVAVSLSLVAYFGYILRRDMDLEKELDSFDSKLRIHPYRSRFQARVRS